MHIIKKFKNNSAIKRCIIALLYTAIFLTINLRTNNANAVLQFSPYMKLDLGYSTTSGLNYKYKNGMSNAAQSWSQTWAQAVADATKTDLAQYRPNKQAKGFEVGMGVGSIFSRFFRGELIVSYAQLKNKPTKSGTDDNVVYAEQFFQQATDIRGTANLYLSLPFSVDLAPFFGGGIGVSSNGHSIKFTPTNTIRVKTNTEDGQYNQPYPTKTFYARYDQLSDNTLSPKTTDPSAPSIVTIKGKNNIEMAYQGSIGLSYQVSDGMYFDMAHRIENDKEYIKSRFSNPGFVTQSVIIGTTGAIDATIPEYQSYQDFSLTKYTKNIIMLSFRSEF